MPKCVRLLALKPYVFKAYMRRIIKMTQHDAREGNSTFREKLNEKVEQYYNASDAILNIFLNYHETHYQYVNPYVA